MSAFIDVNGNKKEVTQIFANVNGEKKEIVSGWTNVDGSVKQIYGKFKKIFAIFVLDGNSIYKVSEGESNVVKTETDSFDCYKIGSNLGIAKIHDSSFIFTLYDYEFNQLDEFEYVPTFSNSSLFYKTIIKSYYFKNVGVLVITPNDSLWFKDEIKKVEECYVGFSFSKVNSQYGSDLTRMVIKITDYDSSVNFNMSRALFDGKKWEFSDSGKNSVYFTTLGNETATYRSDVVNISKIVFYGGNIYAAIKIALQEKVSIATIEYGSSTRCDVRQIGSFLNTSFCFKNEENLFVYKNKMYYFIFGSLFVSSGMTADGWSEYVVYIGGSDSYDKIILSVKEQSGKFYAFCYDNSVKKIVTSNDLIHWDYYASESFTKDACFVE